MNVPIIDNLLGVVSNGAEFINQKDKRRRQAIIRSAKMLARKLEGVELPPRAEHYLSQMNIRIDRLV